MMTLEQHHKRLLRFFEREWRQRRRAYANVTRVYPDQEAPLRPPFNPVYLSRMKAAVAELRATTKTRAEFNRRIVALMHGPDETITRGGRQWCIDYVNYVFPPERRKR